MRSIFTKQSIKSSVIFSFGAHSPYRLMVFVSDFRDLVRGSFWYLFYLHYETGRHFENFKQNNIESTIKKG